MSELSIRERLNETESLLEIIASELHRLAEGKPIKSDDLEHNAYDCLRCVRAIQEDFEKIRERLG